MHKYVFALFFIFAQKGYSSFSLPFHGVLSFERYSVFGCIVNRGLRARDIKVMRSNWVHNLDLGLQLLPTSMTQMEVFRFEKRDEAYISNLAAADVIEYEGYVSTSYSGYCHDITGGEPNIFYVIKHSSGRNIVKYAHTDESYDYKRECEILLPRRSKFRILGIDRSGRHPVVYMEEIVPDIKEQIRDLEFRELPQGFFE